jgi:hypothetical protein
MNQFVRQQDLPIAGRWVVATMLKDDVIANRVGMSID